MSVPDENAPIMVYITAPDNDEAMVLASALVSARLAACANVVGEIQSIFWWDDQPQAEGEVALIVKSRAGNLNAIIDKINALHSYECPCVVALPIMGGNPDFLSWIIRETT